MKKIAMFILIFLDAVISNAQQDISRYILIHFKHGIQQEIKKGQVKKEALITNVSLSNSLKGIGINKEMLEVASPNFKQSDTLRKLEDGTVLRRMDKTKQYRIAVPRNVSVDELIERLRKIPEVLFACESMKGKTGGTPNDTKFASQQWALDNSGTPGSDIHAKKAWDIYTGRSTNIIAIVDDGINVSHEDLDSKIVGGNPGYLSNHGSHVAGIAAAESNNTQGITGVDWSSKVLSKRMDGIFDTDIADRIMDAVDYSSAVRTFNHSWFLGNIGTYNEPIAEAIAYAYKANRVTVALAGNTQEGSPGVANYPGACNNVIAVGATDSTDAIANFSVSAPYVDVVAPGVGIYSAYASGYGRFSGTSQASPHVAGIASLLKGYKLSAYNDDIENLIKLSADKLPGMLGANYTNTYGFGRVNAENALKFLNAPYSLVHYNAVGGTVSATIAKYNNTFVGLPGLSDGTYSVKRYFVTKEVTIPETYCNIVGAWGRGVGTTGYRANANGTINYTEGFCEVISQTDTTVLLATNVYEVFDTNDNSVGFYPCEPQDVSFNYTVLGIKPDYLMLSVEQKCGYAQIIAHGSTGPHNWTVDGDLLINDTVTTYTSTGDTIFVYGTYGNVYVSGGSCNLVNITRPVLINQLYPHMGLLTSVIDFAPWTQYKFGVTNPDPGWSYQWSIVSGDAQFVTSSTGSQVWIETGTSNSLLRVTVTDGCGATGSDGYDIWLDIPSLKMYPNPANNELTVEYGHGKQKSLSDISSPKKSDSELPNGISGSIKSETVTIKIFDSNGKVLLTKDADTSQMKATLDISGIPNGNYFVHVVRGKNVVKKQITIKH